MSKYLEKNQLIYLWQKVKNYVDGKVVSGGFKYSTTEQWTGDYWIDGKKIYCKYIDATVATFKDQIQVIPNLNFIIDLEGRAYANWGQYWPIPCLHAESGYAIYLYWSSNLSSIAIQYGTYYSDNNRVFGWVRYTKTTN